MNEMSSIRFCGFFCGIFLRILLKEFSLIFLPDVFFFFLSPRGASMPTRVGDGHWWFFEFRLLLLSQMLTSRVELTDKISNFSRTAHFGKLCISRHVVIETCCLRD